MASPIVHLVTHACLASVLAVTAASAREEKVRLDHVPSPVMDAVKARFAGAKLTGAARETEEGKTVYEVSLEEAGRNVDVTLTPEGEMLLIEKTIEKDSLPDPVLKSLQQAYPGAVYRTVEEIVEVRQGKERLAAYELELLVGGGRKEVKVDPAGSALTEATDQGD